MFSKMSNVHLYTGHVGFSVFHCTTAQPSVDLSCPSTSCSGHLPCDVIMLSLCRNRHSRIAMAETHWIACAGTLCDVIEQIANSRNRCLPRDYDVTMCQSLSWRLSSLFAGIAEQTNITHISTNATSVSMDQHQAWNGKGNKMYCLSVELPKRGGRWLTFSRIQQVIYLATCSSVFSRHYFPTLSSSDHFFWLTSTTLRKTQFQTQTLHKLTK